MVDLRVKLSGLLLLLSLGLPGCQRGPAAGEPSRLAPLPQAELIRVYTNHEPAASYTELDRPQTRPGDNLEQVIVETIAAAKTNITVAVQELRLPRIAAALEERQQAGVKIRVMLENTYSRPFSSFTEAEVDKWPDRERDRYRESRRLIDQNGDGQLSSEEIATRDALVMLDRAQIPRLDDTADGSAGSDLMHHKFLVVDDRTVIVTSANLTPSDIHGDLKVPASRGNANSLLKITSPELAQLLTEEFNLMWGDGPGGKKDSKFGTRKPLRPARQVTIGDTRVEVQFSPTARSVPWDSSSNGLIAKTLSGATQTIELALFVFSDQNLVNKLEPLHQNGVQIRALIDPGFAFRPYSEALDLLGVTLTEECKTESTNRPWQNPITTVGVPRMPPGDLLHHKFGIIDQKVVIMGSHNWTEAANNGNDETLLVVHSPVVAAHYQREFDRLYTDAILGVPPAIKKKAAAQKQQCPQVQARGSGSTPQPQPSDRPNDRPTPAVKPSQPAPATPTVTPTESASSSQSNPNRINLNTATQAELETLPGVGPKLALRIIAAREQKPFGSLEDLDRVPGMGSKQLDKLRDRVTW